MIKDALYALSVSIRRYMSTPSSPHQCFVTYAEDVMDARAERNLSWMSFIKPLSVSMDQQQSPRRQSRSTVRAKRDDESWEVINIIHSTVEIEWTILFPDGIDQWLETLGLILPCYLSGVLNFSLSVNLGDEDPMIVPITVGNQEDNSSFEVPPLRHEAERDVMMATMPITMRNVYLFHGARDIQPIVNLSGLDATVEIPEPQ